MDEVMAKAARAFGKAYGLLNSVKPLTQAEMHNARIRPLYSFTKIHNVRVAKLSEEKTSLLNEIMDDVPADFGAHALTLAEQAEWEVGYFQWQRGGRPPINGSTMPVRQVRVHDELWEKVKSRAEADGVTISDVVRSALTEYCK